MTSHSFFTLYNTLGLSDIQLAKDLGGYDRTAVYRWRTGSRKVPPAVLKLMEEMAKQKSPHAITVKAIDLQDNPTARCMCRIRYDNSTFS